jgi:hypothetical protein
MLEIQHCSYTTFLFLEIGPRASPNIFKFLAFPPGGSCLLQVQGLPSNYKSDSLNDFDVHTSKFVLVGSRFCKHFGREEMSAVPDNI